MADDKAKAQAFAHRVVDFAPLDACIKYFEEKQVDLDQPDPNGWTVLMTCCAAGRDDLIEFVLEKTNNVMTSTVPNGTTVMHLAAMNRNFRIIKALLATSAQRVKLSKLINLPNANGDTPLLVACVAKNMVAVQLLLEMQVDLNCRNCHHLTPLHCAVRVVPQQEDVATKLLMAQSGEIVQLLLQTDTAQQINQVTRSGDTALHIAIQCHHEVAVRHLLAEKDVDLTIRNRANLTPMELARTLPCHQVLELLEQRWKVLEEQSNAYSEQLLVNGKDKDTLEVQALKTKKAKDKRSKQPTKANGSAEAKSPTEQQAEQRQSQLPPQEATEEEVTPTDQESTTAIKTRATDASKECTGSREVESQDLLGDWQECKSKRSKRRDDNSNRPMSHANGNKNQKQLSSRVVAQDKNKPQVEQSTRASSTQAKSHTKPQSIPVINSSKPAVAAVIAATTKPTAAQVDLSTKQPSSPAIDRANNASNAALLTTNSPIQLKFAEQFPLAAEMDISVDKFITLNTEELHGLSISQLETLQEAHLNAYQQLLKKKLELVGDLENQRTQARFELEKDMLVFR